MTPSRRALLGALAAAPLLPVFATSPSWAQAPAGDPVRLRGTVASLAGNALAVTTREGPVATVALADTVTIVALRRVALSEVTPGTSVGVVAEPGADGQLEAVAITVLPPGARIQERQFAWDLRPGTSMNDGPVDAVVESGSGGMLTLRIGGRMVPVRVPPTAPLLMPIPAARADLVPGAAVYVVAARAADGTLSAARVTVGKDGVNPAV